MNILNFVLKEDIIKKFEFMKNELNEISVDLEKIISLKEVVKAVTYTHRSLNEKGLSNINLEEAKYYFKKYRLNDTVDKAFIRNSYNSNYSSFYIRILLSKYNRKLNKKKRTIKVK